MATNLIQIPIFKHNLRKEFEYFFIIVLSVLTTVDNLRLSSHTSKVQNAIRLPHKDKVQDCRTINNQQSIINNQ